MTKIGIIMKVERVRKNIVIRERNDIVISVS